MRARAASGLSSDDSDDVVGTPAPLEDASEHEHEHESEVERHSPIEQPENVDAEATAHEHAATPPLETDSDDSIESIDDSPMITRTARRLEFERRPMANLPLPSTPLAAPTQRVQSGALSRGQYAIERHMRHSMLDGFATAQLDRRVRGVAVLAAEVEDGAARHATMPGRAEGVQIQDSLLDSPSPALAAPEASSTGAQHESAVATSSGRRATDAPRVERHAQLAIRRSRAKTTAGREVGDGGPIVTQRPAHRSASCSQFAEVRDAW